MVVSEQEVWKLSGSYCACFIIHSCAREELALAHVSALYVHIELALAHVSALYAHLELALAHVSVLYAHIECSLAHVSALYARKELALVSARVLTLLIRTKF